MISGCASNNGDNFKSPNEITRSNSGLRLEPRIMHTNENNEQNEDEKSASAEDFDQIARQKIQQFLDMSSTAGIHAEDYNNYIKRYAKKLWFDPEKAEKIWLQSGFNTADSIKITHTQLLHFEEAGNDQSIGTYQINIKIYRKGQFEKNNKKVQIYFETIDLPIDDKIYKTIKAKILSIE